MFNVRTIVAVSIAGLWALSYLVAVAEHDFTGFQLTTPVMVIVGAWLWHNDDRGQKG